MNASENLKKLQKRCEKYSRSDMYVYKACCDASSNKDNTFKWLVVLKKCVNTINNESRGVHDKHFAKFRADKLRTIKIINVNKPSLIKKYIVNKPADDNLPSAKYQIGEITRCDVFNDNLHVVCGGGIHYFKTLVAAYYYSDVPFMKSYIGEFMSFYDDCGKREEGYVINGNNDGLWTKWANCGVKQCELIYSHGEIIQKIGPMI